MKHYSPFDSVKVILSGPGFFEEMSKVIRNAKEKIHIQTYILSEDKTGIDVLNELKIVSKRGVEVTILVDGFGSRELDDGLIQELKNVGISFRFFSKLFSFESGYLGRRLHHKILVADDSVALLGGINISDKYHGQGNQLPWLDFAIRIDGACCQYLDRICEGMYHKKIGESIEKSEKVYQLEHGIRFRRNDWLMGKNEIHQSYIHAIDNAKKSITLVASYFIPGPNFLKSIRRAAKRGVQIRLLETGNSDVPFFKLAEKYLYPGFLSSNIKIYEWPGSVMHGKTMIVDKEWITIGSYNVNYLSHYSSIELNADIKDPSFAKEFSNQIDQIIDQYCHKVDQKEYLEKHNILYQWLKALAYYSIRFILRTLQPKKNIGNYQN